MPTMSQPPIPWEILAAVLRNRKPPAAALAEAGLSAEQFDAALRAELERRLPPDRGRLRAAGLRRGAEIRRDRRGVPHITAEDPADLYFAWGYATAADRLWQMDCLRRAAHGRLPEILGLDALPEAVEVRTLGITQIAEETVARLGRDTLDALAAYADGVNAHIADRRGRLPVEFDLLEYDCEPWMPADSVAVLKHFWWRLTGRLWMITAAEVASWTLGGSPAYAALLGCEGRPPETILAPGDNRAAPADAWPPAPVGEQLNLGMGRPVPRGAGSGRTASRAMPAVGAAAGVGSNTWAIASGRTATGAPLLAGDPHIPYGAPVLWHEAHVVGAGMNAAGFSVAGVPGILFGRNLRGAWGITNALCSQRDLFRLPVERGSGDTYRVAGNHHRLLGHSVSIPVRGGGAYKFTRKVGDHGPVVNHLLPEPLASDRPVALRWVGAEPSDEVGCLLSLQRAATVEQFRGSLRGWGCPSLNFQWADADGHIAHQTAGRIPVRRTAHRGLRDVADPRQHWAGHWAFEQLPFAADPKSGLLAAANNPVVPPAEDPGLGGVWLTDARARRVRSWFESVERPDAAACAAGQADVFSERAAAGVPALLAAVPESPAEPELTAVRRMLAAWDFRMAADSPAAGVWEMFFHRWKRAVIAERFDPADAALVAPLAEGVAADLLIGDAPGWFAAGEPGRIALLRQAFADAVCELAGRLGPDPAGWAWGRLHTVRLTHPLGGRPLAAGLFNVGPRPIDGASHTLNQQAPERTAEGFDAVVGPAARIVADLSRPVLLSVSAMGNSGHPGSPHYRDQWENWTAGRLYELPLDRVGVEKSAPARLELHP
jgi:penicillin amidase